MIAVNIFGETFSEIFEWAFWSLLFILNVVLSGAYSGLEMGFYRLNKMRLELFAENAKTATKNRSACILRTFAHDSDNLLTVLLIGTNIHSYVASFAVSTLFVLAGLTGTAEYYTMLVVTPVMFVFGDSVPKNLVARMSERIVYRMAWFLRLADIAFKLVGLSYLVRGVSRLFLTVLGRRTKVAGLIGPEGLMSVFTEARASGTITPLQQQMAGRAMQIETVKLIDVYEPIDKIFTAPADISRTEFIELLKLRNYSRIPLLDASKQITGIVHIHDVLTDQKQLTPEIHATSPLVLRADTKVTDAIYTMQQARESMSVVKDSGGEHIGIVTMKDLIEEIVGELQEW
ncbi:MAG: DUF21 domain-containing protein [Phycisphaerae bacterium]|nr:DUF21 domain-containing protein [Phycisphaerae bacterium]